MTDVLDVVLCADRGALIGLHVTLSTALRHLSATIERVNIYLINDGLIDEDFDGLRETVSLAGFSGSVELIPSTVDTSLFRGFRNHVGHGWMTYARLVAPEILPCERLLYLDTDLLIFADLAQLFDMDLGGAPFGAASWGDAGHSNDCNFFQKHELLLTQRYFNAGVLLFDAVKWRAEGWTEKCLATGERFGKDLPSADQTILNVVVEGGFQEIPRKFNTPVTPGRGQIANEDATDRVVHLVARPKPWDAMGYVNGQFEHFREALPHTAIADYRIPLISSRNIRQLRAYLKCWKNLVFGVRRPA